MGGLTAETTTEDLDAHFKQLGDPSPVCSEILKKGVACVAYSSAEDAETAMAAFNGSELGGAVIQTDAWTAKPAPKGKGEGSKGKAGAGKWGGGGAGGKWGGKGDIMTQSMAVAKGAQGKGGWDAWGGKGAKGGWDAWGAASAWQPGSDAWGGKGSKGFAGKGPAGWGGGGGGKWGGGRAPTPAPAETAQGGVVWISFADNALTQQGFPADGAAMVYEKGPNIFSSAAFVLGDCVGDIATEVEIIHDADWTQYPDIGETIKAATGEEHCFAVAVCASQAKWGLGLASGWKGRESAAKLALAVSMASDNPQLNGKLTRAYPEFGAICQSQGFAMAAPSASGAAAKRGGGGGYAPAAPAGNESGPPAIHFISVPAEASVVAQGLPADAPAIAHSKAKKDYFSSAHHILQELVTDLSEVSFEDDADWTVMPEIGAALAAAGAEDNSYVVASCPSQACWGVGLAAGWKGRESAGKMALALALAQATGRVEELGNTYPEFGEICAGAGLMQMTKKRRKGGW